MYEHDFSRVVPVDVQTAFTWMTDYSQDDMRFYDAESGTRKFERVAPDKVKLTTEEVERGHKTEIDGIVTLSPPDHWKYTGTMTRDGKAVAYFDEYFSLQSLGDGKKTRFIIHLEARPLTIGMKLYVVLFSKRLDAWLDGPHQRIVQAMVSEFGQGLAAKLEM